MKDEPKATRSRINAISKGTNKKTPLNSPVRKIKEESEKDSISSTSGSTPSTPCTPSAALLSPVRRSGRAHVPSSRLKDMELGTSTRKRPQSLASAQSEGKVSQNNLYQFS